MSPKGSTGKSVDLCSHAARLDRLTLRNQWSRQILAEKLGVSESMIYQVLRGSRDFSARALYRLEQLELESGIDQPVPDAAELRRRLETLTEEDATFYASENDRYLELSKPSVETRLRALETTVAEIFRAVQAISSAFGNLGPAKPGSKKEGKDEP